MPPKPSSPAPAPLSPDEMLRTERRLWNEGYSRIMGLDEVGRGCLAGPVVAAGVVLPPNAQLPGVTDSKQVKTHAERQKLAGIIKEQAVFYGIRECSPAEIDEHNILKASFMAMRKCTAVAGAQPDYLLIDGNRYMAEALPHQCLVKGDARSASIAAASILAKVYRDELMFQMHELYPFYAWNTNVGYPTAAHYAGLREYGACPLHRQSFKLKTTRRYLPHSGGGA